MPSRITYPGLLRGCLSALWPIKAPERPFLPSVCGNACADLRGAALPGLHRTGSADCRRSSSPGRPVGISRVAATDPGAGQPAVLRAFFRKNWSKNALSPDANNAPPELTFQQRPVWVPNGRKRRGKQAILYLTAVLGHGYNPPPGGRPAILHPNVSISSVI